jgi:hypothetical protein
MAWGANGHGESEHPLDLTNTIAIAAGIEHSVAVRGDGTVEAWGNPFNPAVTVPTSLAGVKTVAAGWFHSVALLTNGTVTIWGDNTWGQANMPAGLTNVTAVAAGMVHSLALRADGTVAAWGWNSDGQTNVPAGLSNVVAVAAGRMHSLAVKADGTVVAWGLNDHGQTNVPTDLTNAMAIAGGTGHSVALKDDGTIVAWGDNSAGQCDVPANLHTVKLIAAGGNYTLAAVFSPYLHYPGKAESLVENMLHMLNSRTNGNGNAYFDLPPFDAGPLAGGYYHNSWGGTNLPTMQTNFWLRDVTNIYTCSVASLDPIWWSATNQNFASYVCTPISPRHAVTAGHVGSFFQPGQKMVWFEPGGTYFTNTVVDYISEYEFPNRQDTDFCVIIFAEDFPRFAKIMPSVVCSGNDLSFVCRHRVGTTFTVASSALGGLTTEGINFGDYADSPGGTNHVLGWYGGDSSDPMWAVINNEAIFVGPAHNGNSATPLANYINMVNADMATLSNNNTNSGASIYSVTLYNILR